MEKHLESLEKARHSLRIADHIAYVTYPLLNDKRLLLKSLDAIYKSLMHIINAILQYEYLWRRIQLYKDPRENFETFKKKCARRYNISDSELNELMSILNMVENHKKASVEFLRKERVVIMSDNLKTISLDIVTMKGYVLFNKSLLEKVQFLLNRA